MTTSSRRHVTDETGIGYELAELISSGGQGHVYKVQGQPTLAVKLLKYGSELDQIRRVRRYPLEGLNVARPATLLRVGGPGYIMQMAQDMAPLSATYLPLRDFGVGHDARWYLETGGLRRRLRIAARTADLMADLHARALAYVDLNPGNVMVSNDLNRDETWLIDTDNLTSSTNGASRFIGMPGYLSPERSARGHIAAPSTLADTYSLAVLVLKMLVLSHPLIGTAAESGYDGDQARDRGDQGKFPYIADPDDDSNRPASQLTASLLELSLSPTLKSLAARMFTAGRFDPTVRDGAARWRDALFSAADNTIACPTGCGWTMYRDAAACPSCRKPLGSTPVLSIHTPWGPVGRENQTYALALNPSGATTLDARRLWGRHGDATPIATVTIDGRHVELRHDSDVVVTDPATGAPVRGYPLPRPGGWKEMRLEVTGRPTRVLAIRSTRRP